MIGCAPSSASLLQAILEAGCLEALAEAVKGFKDMQSPALAEMCAAMAVLASEGL